VGNKEAQVFTCELLSPLICIEDTGGLLALLDETRRYCAMKERITTVELESARGPWRRVRALSRIYFG
jgi:hypothetical protein